MRYTLKREGVVLAQSDDSMDLVNKFWYDIKHDWHIGYVLEDNAKGVYCSLWACVWSAAYNGVELSPMVL